MFLPTQTSLCFHEWRGGVVIQFSCSCCQYTQTINLVHRLSRTRKLEVEQDFELTSPNSESPKLTFMWGKNPLKNTKCWGVSGVMFVLDLGFFWRTCKNFSNQFSWSPRTSGKQQKYLHEQRGPAQESTEDVRRIQIWLERWKWWSPAATGRLFYKDCSCKQSQGGAHPDFKKHLVLELENTCFSLNWTHESETSLNSGWMLLLTLPYSLDPCV